MRAYMSLTREWPRRPIRHFDGVDGAAGRARRGTVIAEIGGDAQLSTHNSVFAAAAEREARAILAETEPPSQHSDLIPIGGRGFGSGHGMAGVLAEALAAFLEG